MDDAIASTSSSSGASQLQQVSARSVAWTLSLPWSTVHIVLHHILRRYLYKIKMLQELKPHDDTRRIDLENFVLSKIRRNTLQFGADRVLSRSFENAWPPVSQDNPCNFYLLGHLKDMVYRERRVSVTELKSSIMRHIRRVTAAILNTTVDHAVLRFQPVVTCGGSHIKHIM
ncbi:uncharacterized protein TNCV_5113211 [Trichonephila clavipes]|nr:uncharacterized protein TNCV_5113211 [Trichonephila clavipes]